MAATRSSASPIPSQWAGSDSSALDNWEAAASGAVPPSPMLMLLGRLQMLLCLLLLPVFMGSKGSAVPSPALVGSTTPPNNRPKKFSNFWSNYNSDGSSDGILTRPTNLWICSTGGWL